MTFLNPLFLIGLLGMGIPLVIHLLSRRTARRVEFSSLDFLVKLDRKSLRRVRVRQLLLLIARMLLLACVAIAMSRPTLTGVSSGDGRGATSAVIVLDGSYSMNAKDDGPALFEGAKERARRVLATFHDGDEVTLFVPGGEGGGGVASGIRDLGLVGERVDSARPGGAAVDLATAIRASARTLEDARHPNREVHVISDFQRTAWNTDDEAELAPEEVGLFGFPVGEAEPPENAWVESVDFSGQILEKGSPIEFRTVIASGPGFGPREVGVEMEIDGRVIDRRRIDLGPASRVGITFRETFPEDGLHLGMITIQDGGAGLPEDDRRYFTLRTARAVPVLLISENGRVARYLESALSPEGAVAGGFAVRSAAIHELRTASREREAVVILADVERLGESELQGLKDYLSDGGGLLVFPGPKTDAAAWGRSFLPKFLPGTLTDVTTSESAFAITRLDPSHPLFEIFRAADAGIGDVRFTRALRLRPQAGTAVLASYSNGDAALLESSLLPGRVLFFTSSPDPAWSDLPLTGIFLPLIHEAVRYLSESGSFAAQELEVGEAATVWLPSVPEGGGGVTLRSPDGSSRTVGVEPGPGGYALELSLADVPGIWSFETERGDTLAALAANIPARESDLTRTPLDEVRARLEESRGTILEGEDGLGRQVREARLGREIGRWFLWGAAFFLMAEMLLATRRPVTSDSS